MGVRRKQTGSAQETNCDATKNDNSGCGVDGDSDTFGQAFNRGNGGVMAMEWRTEGIRMWQFPTGKVPSDITEQKPNPGGWGEALADFPNTDCNIGNHFKNQSIVANINLCGELTESVYSSDNCKLYSLILRLPCQSLTKCDLRPKQLHRLRRQQPRCIQERILGVWLL